MTTSHKSIHAPDNCNILFLPNISDKNGARRVPKRLAKVGNPIIIDICNVVAGSFNGLILVSFDFNFGITGDGHARDEAPLIITKHTEKKKIKK